MPDSTVSAWRLSVAPMMAWTDRHCRSLHRLITRHTRLYTEMITSAALAHGDVAAHLDFDANTEHPVALQLGGSDPHELAQAARLGAQWGYDEINLNCGCPSDRVQRGAFGACLMARPALVADCVKAMRDVVPQMPVTVKHRLGIDRETSYAFARDFVGTVADAGCQVFIVHARNAWLDGLSPKDNRDIPPLRYADARRLKQDFPTLSFAINGGIEGDVAISEHLASMDGVMVGRAAYHDPWTMHTWDDRFWRADSSSIPRPATLTQDDVELAYVDYMARQVRQGVPWPSMARHMLGLRHGQAGARRWRQIWSDQGLKNDSPHAVHRLASAALRAAASNARPSAFHHEPGARPNA